MKRSALVTLLFLGSLILRGDGCKIPGFSSDSTDSPGTVHPTQIVVSLGVFNSKNESASVSIDGVGVGNAVYKVGVTKQVTAGHHTVSASGNVSGANWPEEGIDVDDQETLNYTLGCDEVKLNITTSVACKTKGVSVILFSIVDDAGAGSHPTVGPGDAITIKTGSGITHIQAVDQDKGTVLFEADTPFLKCGSSYNVAVTCD